MKLLLNDSSVLLNLLATEHLASIAEVTGWQLAICRAVREEAKRLRNADTGEMTDVDISPLIESGLLQVLDLADDEEQTRYVEQSIVVDDGEAMSIAIAVTRHLELAMDDKQATNHSRRTFPSLRLWTTPEILKHWADAGNVSAQVIREAILRIETRARYFPPKAHMLAVWWQESKRG